MEESVHIIEPGGRGGVYGHAVKVASLAVNSGLKVTVHTAFDCLEVEGVDSTEIEICRCFWWSRNWRYAHMRRTATVARQSVNFLLHIRALFRCTGNIVHVHGCYRLLSMLPALATNRKAAFVYSPHNTFRRASTDLTESRIWRLARMADITVAYSTFDASKLHLKGARRTRVMPLTMPVVRPAADDVASLRAKILEQGRYSRLLLIPGFIREDKDYLTVLQALEVLPDAKLVIAGSLQMDERVLLGILAQDSTGRVEVIQRYFDDGEFSELVMAADLVLLPYTRASGSGVLEVCDLLGVPTVASHVGGMIGRASKTFKCGDYLSLVRGIESVGEFERSMDHKQDPHSWPNFYRDIAISRTTSM